MHSCGIGFYSLVHLIKMKFILWSEAVVVLSADILLFCLILDCQVTCSHLSNIGGETMKV